MAGEGMNGTIPVVSVCIANYNGMAVIDDCLRSVLEQDSNNAIEILIHDDASSDSSAQYIRDRYPEIRLIESSENVGFCVANNRMAAVARGRYLLLLNNDAALFPNALQTLLSEAQRINQSAILSLPQHDATTGKLIDIGCLLDPFCNPVPNLRRERNDVAMVIGACLWIPKTLWEELEGFPEWFGSIGEDLYLCCRARLAGYSVRALGTSGYRHLVGQSFGGGKVAEGKLKTTYQRRALSERNKTFVLAITYPGTLLPLMLPLHLGLLLVEGCILSAIYRSTTFLQDVYFPTFLAIFEYYSQLRNVRQLTMGNRRITPARFFSVFDPLPYKLRMLIKHGLPEVR